MTESIESKYRNSSPLRCSLATLLVGLMPLSAPAQTVQELEGGLRNCEADLAHWNRRMQEPCRFLLTPSESCEEISQGLESWKRSRDASPIPQVLSQKFIECDRKSTVASNQCAQASTAGPASAGHCARAQRESDMCQRELSRLKSEYLYRPGADPRAILKDDDIRQAAVADGSIKAFDNLYQACLQNQRKWNEARSECRRLKSQVISVANACDDFKIKLQQARQQEPRKPPETRRPPPRPAGPSVTAPAGGAVQPMARPPATSSTPGPRPGNTAGAQSGYELPTILEGKLTNIWVYCDPKRVPRGTKPSCKAYAGIQNGRAYPPDISSRVTWTNDGPLQQPGSQTVTASVGWIKGSDTVWVEDAAAVPPRPGRGSTAGSQARPGPAATQTPSGGALACLGWEYSPWTPCKGPGTPTGIAGECYGSQSRTGKGAPAGCSGTPASPLQQRCVYAPKVPNQCG